MLASTLRQALLTVWLVTAGGKGTAALLEHPSDLVDVWTRRTLEPPQPARALAVARSLRSTLVGQSGFEPVILLLAQSNFGAEEEQQMPVGLVPGLRALFVHHAGQSAKPPWSSHCERWLSMCVGEESRVSNVLGELLA
jgi:ATP-dependent Clp protease ATP-binding subunit ClpC